MLPVKRPIITAGFTALFFRFTSFFGRFTMYPEGRRRRNLYLPYKIHRMTYLVPFDFSPVAESALKHALLVAAITDSNVELLHLVKSQGDIAAAEKKFGPVLAALPENQRAKVTTKVIAGDIFTDISKIAEFTDAQLIIMGTHGAKGFQKLFGSYAIKVITSSAIPFIITQEKAPGDSFRTIVLPVDLTKESVQILKFAADLASKFNSEIHLVGAEQSDPWQAKRIANNIQLAKNHLSKHKIRHVVSTLKGDKDFAKEVLEYGAAHNADLYAITYFTEILLPQFDTFAQSMITNAQQMPVLVVNAHALSSAQQYAFISV
jgi:nucleotide-binding universal stress UspA family protein